MPVITPLATAILQSSLSAFDSFGSQRVSSSRNCFLGMFASSEVESAEGRRRVSGNSMPTTVYSRELDLYPSHTYLNC